MEFHGTAVSTGIAIGHAFLYRIYEDTVEDRRVPPEETSREEAVLHQALAAAEAELDTLIGTIQEDGQERKDILTAHLMILRDPELLSEIQGRISRERCCASWAIRQVYDRFIGLFDGLDDPRMKERASDMADVRSRLLRCAQGLPDRSLTQLPESCVVFAEELLPSDTVMLDPKRVRGIVTERGGGATSHTAIIARSLGIPAVLGVTGAMDRVPENAAVILDAVKGRVLVEPGEDAVRRYMAARDSQLRREQTAQGFLEAAAVTKDGVPVKVELNVGTMAGGVPDSARYTAGIGLLRSEFLYMESSQLPSEEEQFRAYRAALEAVDGKPVVLRTLDIGGDKRLPYLELPPEDNPFLGVRALRLCFAHPDLFHTQLRAALRASAYGDLRLMFPMVSSLEDFQRAKAHVEQVREELQNEGIPFRRDMQLGVMIEVPAAALTAELFAREADFASIGTNDLVQYLTAADRMNGETAVYYQNFHPAVLRVIGGVTAAFDRAGKPVCVCGELGGMPEGVLALLGLGLRRLSVSPAHIAAVKQVIAGVSVAEARELMDSLLALEHADEIKARLTRYLSEHVYSDGSPNQSV